MPISAGRGSQADERVMFLMTELPPHMKETRAREADRMRELVAEYLGAADRLPGHPSFAERKAFFAPHFAHLTGISHAWIVSMCAMDVSRQLHDRHLAGMADADKTSCDDGWQHIVDRFLSVAREQPGFLLRSAGEKWGALQLRYSCDETAVEACRIAEKDAVDASLRTCEICGQAGHLRVGGWAKTRCDDHSAGWDDVGDVLPNLRQF
jgi:hypothetical protein